MPLAVYSEHSSKTDTIKVCIHYVCWNPLTALRLPQMKCPTLCTGLQVLPPPHLPLPFSSLTPAPLASLHFLKQTRQVPTSGPLDELFLLPEGLFSQTVTFSPALGQRLLTKAIPQPTHLIRWQLPDPSHSCPIPFPYLPFLQSSFTTQQNLYVIHFTDLWSVSLQLISKFYKGRNFFFTVLFPASYLEQSLAHSRHWININKWINRIKWNLPLTSLGVISGTHKIRNVKVTTEKCDTDQYVVVVSMIIIIILKMCPKSCQVRPELIMLGWQFPSSLLTCPFQYKSW